MLDWISVLSIIAALIGSVGGLAGLAAFWNARTAARQADFETWKQIVVTLQAENKREAKRAKELEEQLDEARAERSELFHQVVRMEQENTVLRKQVASLEERLRKLSSE